MNKATGRTFMATLALSAAVSSVAGEMPYEPERVTSIAAVSNTRSQEILGFRSGLFVAYSGDFGGRVAYFEEDEEYSPDAIVETASFSFHEPTAIAESEGNLIVWENAERALYRLDLRSGKRFPITEYGLDIEPSQIEISPEGVVVLLDQHRGRVYWTTLDGGELRSDAFKTESTSIAFLSWDKLAILDREQQSISVLTLWIDGDWVEPERESELSLKEKRRSRAGDFRAIASQDGALYVADDSRIFSYIEATGELVLAVDYDAGLHDIRQLEVSADSFYVIDSEGFRNIDRTVPVEVIFEAPAFVSQLALLQLYDYLDSRNVLPSREVTAGRQIDTLEHFLVEESVFIASSDAFPERRKRGGFLWLGARKIPPTAQYEAQYDKFERIFCGMNRDFCNLRRPDSLFLQPVRSGTTLQVPNLLLESRLGTRTFTLQGATAADYLDVLIVSPELRARADESLLQRLNKKRCGGRTGNCLQQSRGELTLPYETWSLSTAVLGPDLNADSSALSAVTDYGDIQIFSQQVFTKQEAYSHHLNVPAGITVSDTCNSLSEKHEAWLEKLAYPSSYEHFSDSVPRVGIIEQEVLKKHQVFELQIDSPTWHAYDPIEIDLVADPKPNSLAGGSQAVESSDVYTRTKHHGTHVSAMIGGRAGHCWSGLLPESRLVHIKASSAATIRGGVFEAHSGLVRVVNVSQGLSNSSAFRNILVNDSDFREILFVLAAGNSGKNLNIEDVPSAVIWGQNENIVVVAALDDHQQIIGPHLAGSTQQPGSNWGKRYVDLAAPGFELYSATEDKKYGPATGTSQAAPAVSAAAAYLVDEDVGWARMPGQVKARLIATAKWHDGLDGRVWGGILNLGDAVRFPDLNIVRTTTTGEDTILDIGLNARATLNIDNWPADIYDRDEDDLKYPEKRIKLRDILSLRYNNDAATDGSDNGTFRMVFRDPKHAGNKLRIVLKAQLSGSIRCRQARQWVPEGNNWVDDPLCSEDIDVTQLIHFYRALNYDVDW